MSKKKNKKHISEPRRTQDASTDYLDLKTSAIDRLVDANKRTAEQEKTQGNQQQSPKTAQVTAQEPTDEITLAQRKEARRYQADFFGRIPVVVRALFIKYWFSGAICFFFYFGLGTVITDSIDLIFVLCLATGLFTDIIINPILRFCGGQNSKFFAYMMFRKKKYWTLFANIGYAAIVVAFVWATYGVVNFAIVSAQGLPDTALPLGVEPLLYGLVYLVFDMALIGLRNLIENAVRKNRKAD